MASIHGFLRKIGNLAASGDGLLSLLPTVAADRNYYAEVAPSLSGQVPGQSELGGDPFITGQCYFSVRLVEMRLTAAGNVFASFLPLCLFFLRYKEANADREIPFVMGYNAIEDALGPTKPNSGLTRILFRDIYIARDIPLRSSGVEMFAALCQLADTKLSRGFFDVIATAVNLLGGPAGGAIVRTGEGLLKPLGNLMGTEGVNIRVAVFDGDALRHSGYRILAGADSQEKLQNLLLVDGALHRQTPAGTVEPVNDVEYLLIAFERRTTLNDDLFSAAVTLPFHKIWTELATALASGSTAAANKSFKLLATEVMRSEQLIESDRLLLLSAYTSQIEKIRSQINNRFGVNKSGHSASEGRSVRSIIADQLNSASTDGDSSATPLSIVNDLLSPSQRTNAMQDPTDDGDNDFAKVISNISVKLRALEQKNSKSAENNDITFPSLNPDVYCKASEKLVTAILNTEWR